jgi:3-oxoadipate enol-lactonase
MSINGVSQSRVSESRVPDPAFWPLGFRPPDPERWQPILAMIDDMVRESRVAISGRRVRYLEAGSGWPVVLIHAFPLNADMWRPQLQRVPEGWRFIAPDLRGFGPAAPEPGAITLDDMAQDIAAMLDELAIDTAVIGGLSMGGYITFALFRRAPERFSGMILADTKAQADTPEGLEGRREMIALARAEGAIGVAESMLPKLLGSTSFERRPDLPKKVRTMIEAAGTAAIVAAIEAMMARPDSTNDLARISCPTLVIVGEEDLLTPVSDAVAMQNQTVRSRLVILPEAGHLSNLEVPDGFALALADFLSSNL